MKCRKCKFEEKNLDRRAIHDRLVEALRVVPEHQARDGHGVYYALGALIGSVEMAIDNLDGLCFGCGEDARRATEPKALTGGRL